MGGNGFWFNENFVKTPKIPLQSQPFLDITKPFFFLNQLYKITQLSFLHYCSHCCCCSSLLLLFSSQYCYCSVSFFFINCPIDSLQMIIYYYFTSSLLVYFFVSQSASLSISLSASIIIIIFFFFVHHSNLVLLVFFVYLSATFVFLPCHNCFYHALYVFILRHFRISIKPCHFMYFYNSILLVLFVYVCYQFCLFMSATFHLAKK